MFIVHNFVHSHIVHSTWQCQFTLTVNNSLIRRRTLAKAINAKFIPAKYMTLRSFLISCNREFMKLLVNEREARRLCSRWGTGTLFVICSTPMLCFRAVFQAQTVMNLVWLIWQCLNILQHIESAVDFYLYLIISLSFRSKCVKALRCWK